MARQRGLEESIPLECESCGRMYMQNLLGDLTPIRCDCGDIVLREPDDQALALSIRRHERIADGIVWALPAVSTIWLICAFAEIVMRPNKFIGLMVIAATLNLFASLAESKWRKQSVSMRKKRQRSRREITDKHNKMAEEYKEYLQKSISAAVTPPKHLS